MSMPGDYIYTPDLDDLLQVIRLHRLANGFDYRHCKLLDNQQCICNSSDHQEFTVCPLKERHTHIKVELAFTDTLVTSAVVGINLCFSAKDQFDIIALFLLLGIIITILGASYNDMSGDLEASLQEREYETRTSSNGSIRMRTVAPSSFQVYCDSGAPPPSSHGLSNMVQIPAIWRASTHHT